MAFGAGAARAGDRTPLVGAEPQTQLGRVTVTSEGQIVSLDTSLVDCPQTERFDSVEGGPAPGTNYDGVLTTAGLLFSERFAGQSTSSSGNFDVITGTPTNPITPQVGEPGQNLDVFDYAGNVLTGLGSIGYPDVDAIGEGSIAICFAAAQAKVKISIVGGNGGAATLYFYRRNGDLIDQVVVSDLADLAYAFGTVDGSYTIAGILIQNTDASGIGITNICYDDAPVSARPVTWGTLKRRYR